MNKKTLAAKVCTNTTMALMDADNFYVSCERLYQPWLQNKAVVVLSNNNGCVVARSNEAKRLGIKMGQAWFLVKNKHQIHALSSNFKLYGDISNRFMSLVKKEYSQTDIYSIDEMFYRFTPVAYEPINKTLHKLRVGIDKKVGIPVSIGVGANKTQAKLAIDIAKQSKGRVYCLANLTNKQLLNLYEQFPVQKIWGIGKRTQIKLHAESIFSALDLVNCDFQRLKRNLGVNIVQTALELQGVTIKQLITKPSLNKNILSSRSFGKAVYDLPQLLQVLAQRVESLAQRAFEQNQAISQLKLFMGWGKSWAAKERKWQQAEIPLAHATTDTSTLYKLCEMMACKLWNPNYAYRKIGVLGIPTAFANGSLWHNEQMIKAHKIMSTVQSIRAKLGPNTLRMANLNNPNISLSQSKIKARLNNKNVNKLQHTFKTSMHSEMDLDTIHTIKV